MSTIVPIDSGGFRVYTKGASEIIMKKCSFVVGEDGILEAFNTQMQERVVQVSNLFTIQEKSERGDTVGPRVCMEKSSLVLSSRFNPD